MGSRKLFKCYARYSPKMQKKLFSRNPHKSQKLFYFTTEIRFSGVATMPTNPFIFMFHSRYSMLQR